jgi:hypothetical protein
MKKRCPVTTGKMIEVPGSGAKKLHVCDKTLNVLGSSRKKKDPCPRFLAEETIQVFGSEQKSFMSSIKCSTFSLPC